jgi:hypothetical protein
MKKLPCIYLILACWIITGCVAVIVGAGAGAGAYAYIDGALKRSYQINYDKTYHVVTGILRDLKQPIKEEKTDGVKTTIETERADGTPMTIGVSIIDSNWTEVSVRTGVVGLWKKEISKQFHEFIEERLKSE